MRKNSYFGIALVGLTMLLATVSCTSYKEVPYLQNSNELTNIEQSAELFDARVKIGDLLNINVLSSKDPIASSIYNLTVGALYENYNSLTTMKALQTYQVNNEGYINFPVVGKLHVVGKSNTEIENLILDKIKPAFKEEPVVTVRFANYRISVLGEVTAPGTFVVNNEKINIFEALALARDMTIYGRRDNVKLIRDKEDGKTEIHELNLNDASIVTSPYYYLEQGDIVYVTPNKAKAKNSDIGSTTSLWFSATSILISLVSLLYNILR